MGKHKHKKNKKKTKEKKPFVSDNDGSDSAPESHAPTLAHFDPDTMLPEDSVCKLKTVTPTTPNDNQGFRASVDDATIAHSIQPVRPHKKITPERKTSPFSPLLWRKSKGDLHSGTTSDHSSASPTKPAMSILDRLRQNIRRGSADSTHEGVMKLAMTINAVRVTKRMSRVRRFGVINRPGTLDLSDNRFADELKQVTKVVTSPVNTATPASYSSSSPYIDNSEVKRYLEKLFWLFSIPF